MLFLFGFNCSILKSYYTIKYPFFSSEEQEAVLEKLTTFIQMYWNETLEIELGNIQDICSKSDIDFEFVLDQSGSISVEDWQLSLDIIAEQWITTAIRPRGSKVCGNHVAGRKFSDKSEYHHTRFLDFEPPEPNVYFPEYSNYTQYVADIFQNQKYVVFYSL